MLAIIVCLAYMALILIGFIAAAVIAAAAVDTFF